MIRPSRDSTFLRLDLRLGHFGAVLALHVRNSRVDVAVPVGHGLLIFEQRHSSVLNIHHRRRESVAYEVTCQDGKVLESTRKTVEIVIDLHGCVFGRFGKVETSG